MESDGLLDDVEELHLEDRTEAPQPLREAIRALQIRLGRHDPPMPPATLRAAHDLVFAVQQRLMAAGLRLAVPPRIAAGMPPHALCVRPRTSCHILCRHAVVR